MRSLGAIRAWRPGEHRSGDDLHTVCIRSPSIPHMRELRYWVTKGPRPAGGICSMNGCGTPVRFPLKGIFGRCCPSTLMDLGERCVRHDATTRVADRVDDRTAAACGSHG